MDQFLVWGEDPETFDNSAAQCRWYRPEMTKYLGDYFFCLRRKSQEAMSAWALREEKVYLSMTRALMRLENTEDSP